MLGLSLSLPDAASRIGGGGASYATGAAALLKAETNGLAFAASDDSMEIRDTVTPANNYVGSAITKFGGVRASAAFGYGSTGLLEWGPENLVQSSDEIGGWSTDGSLVTVNDSDGVADKLTDTVANVTHRMYIGLTSYGTGNYTGTIQFKYGSQRYVSVALISSGGEYVVATFDLVSGTVTKTGTSGTATYVSSSIALVSGYYQCSVSGSHTVGFQFFSLIFNASGNPTYTSFAQEAYAGTGTSFLYAKGAQINRGVTACPYIRVTGSIGWGLRRDYDPRVAGAKYLIEAAKTNYCLYSQAMSTAPWSMYYSGVIPNSAIAPDGTMTAGTLTAATAVDANLQQQMTMTISGLRCSASVFVKSYNQPWALLSIYDTAHKEVWFDLTNGVVGTITAPLTASDVSITLLPNGWYRISVSRVVSANNPYMTIIPVNADNTHNTPVDSFKGLYVWGAQFEPGYPSSYIPTTSATVTRAAEIIDVLATTFNKGTVGATVYAKAAVPALVADYPPIIGLNNGTNAQRLVALIENNNTYFAIDPALYSAQNMGVISVLTDFKLALAGALNDMNSACNGTLNILDTSGNVPTALSSMNRLYIGYDPNPRWLNGWVKEGMHLPRRMSDAEITVLTT